MKHFVKFSALLLLLLASACGGSLDMTKISVGPGNVVSWEDAKTIIRDGDVDYVSQTHAGQVSISMEDGPSYETTQPHVDDVIKWVDECGKRDSIAIMTE